MLKFGNKEFNNLQEQVLENANDILEIKQGLGTALPNPIPGPVGPEGKQGEQGVQGIRGTQWTIGSNLPASANEGDIHLTFTGEVYQYVDSSWILRTTIKGPQGVQGERGFQGERGIQGEVGPQGPQGIAAPIYEVKGILNSIEQLPAPSTVASNYAYIIGSAVFGLVDSEWAQITTTLIANVASQIDYDNTNSGLSATNVQRAIDELADINLENGTGTNAIQMKQDGTSGVFDFTGKNANATEIDETLTGDITYGATGNFATVVGGKASAQGKRSMAQGTTTIAKGDYSHAEGNNSVALGVASHAEGTATTANGYSSHAEGHETQSLASAAHAEGYGTIASGTQSHAEGNGSIASGIGSHATGNHTQASGQYSTTAGSGTIADQPDMTAVGRFNTGDIQNAVFVVGTGLSDTNRRNALIITGDGGIFAPNPGTLDESLVNRAYVNSLIGAGSSTKLYKHILKQSGASETFVFINTIETSIKAEATKGSAADINLFASALAVYIFVYGEDIYTNTAYKAIAVGKYGLGKIKLYYLTTSGDLSSAYSLDFTTAVETIEEL